MAPHLLAKILTLEVALRGGDKARAKPAAGAEGGGGEAPKAAEKWSLSAAGAENRPARTLTLETLTEFDPRLCLFRDGKWVAAETP
jgi:hypothetical protein